MTIDFDKYSLFVDAVTSDSSKDFVYLADVMWYVAQACMALDISFDEVIEGNIKKLEKRYPGGKFDINYSEVRAEDDL